jgi:hypothetical protein
MASVSLDPYLFFKLLVDSSMSTAEKFKYRKRSRKAAILLVYEMNVVSYIRSLQWLVVYIFRLRMVL